MLHKLAGTTWGCTAKTLQITTQAMVMSVASYCSPVWMNSAHVYKVDTQVYKALRVVTGTVNSTEIEWLHILSNTVPLHIARQEAALKECKRIAQNSGLTICNDIAAAPDDLRLVSRKPFWCLYREHDSYEELKMRWKKWWNDTSVFQKSLVDDPTIAVSGMDLPRRTWIRVNRFRTGQGCCAFLLHRWNFVQSNTCECGQVQTMEHILQHCNIHRFSGDINELHTLTDNAKRWLESLAVNV